LNPRNYFKASTYFTASVVILRIVSWSPGCPSVYNFFSTEEDFGKNRKTCLNRRRKFTKGGEHFHLFLGIKTMAQSQHNSSRDSPQ
jgi:hypothetical protein